MITANQESMTYKEIFLCSAGCRRGWPWEEESEEFLNTTDEQKVLPKITVVTPSYNQGNFLEATILSVLRQNYPNIEYIVLDGDSSDNSIEVITKYKHNISYWHSKKDRGQADALATGFNMATGDIYCWLNSDDIFLPNALRHVAALFQKHERVSFVYGNRLLIDELGRDTGRHRWPYFLTRYHWYNGQPLAQECCFWRDTLYQQVGGIDREKFFIMDYDLFYRMWRVGKFKKTRQFLGCLRNHDESKNARHQAVRQEELETARKEFNLVAPGYVTSRVINHFDRLQILIEKTSDP
jgi:glycosyltransferase involved in cell wall biosynthesis